MLQETELELVRAAQHGNVAAFERLLRHFEKKMLAVAAGFAHTPDDANDIYQDAMLAAFKALPNFKAEARFSTWLHRIVVNTALSNRRKLMRMWKKMTAVQAEAEIEEYHIEAHSPESVALDEELNSEINRAMRRLSDQERMAFVLCHQQGFKLREAAEIMSCTENAIKVVLFRARNKLKEQLERVYQAQ